MDINEVSMNEILQAHELIWNCSFSYIKPMTLKCAVELGIPDIINKNAHDDQPILLSKLISQLPINPSKAQFIPRLMRILVHFGFFSSHKLDQEEGYSLTPISRLLLKENPLRASPFLLAQLNPLLIAPWHSLTTWLKEEKDAPPFEITNGANLWECMGQEKEFRDMFAGSMAIDSHVVAEIVLGRCRHVFEGLESLVDVGGGTGIMAKAIAEAFPKTKCTVLDLPYLVCDSKGTENLDFVEGDMFKLVPCANAVLLKWILHDWSDEEALIILKNCREAIDWCKEEGGKVIIVDMVIDDEEKSVELQVCFDMLMMANLTGKERNKKEWEILFYGAGFSNWKISPILGARSLIEVYP